MKYLQHLPFLVGAYKIFLTCKHILHILCTKGKTWNYSFKKLLLTWTFSDMLSLWAMIWLQLSLYHILSNNKEFIKSIFNHLFGTANWREKRNNEKERKIWQTCSKKEDKDRARPATYVYWSLCRWPSPKNRPKIHISVKTYYEPC